MNDNEERPELPCPYCHGTGVIAGEFAFAMQVQPCVECDGDGWVQ